MSFYTDTIRSDPQFKSPLRVHDIMLLEPITREAVLGIIADAAGLGIALMCWETYRSPQRQRALFVQGATQLQNVGVHHFGLAADLVKDVNGEPSWKGGFDFMVPLAKKHRLISGIDWGAPGKPHNFVDACHVQRCSMSDQDRLFSGTWYPDAAYLAAQNLWPLSPVTGGPT